MRRHSKRRASQERSLRKAERELNEEGNDRCFFYPFLPRSEYHHLIPKSQNSLLIDCKENLIPISDLAHETITRGTSDQLRNLPNLREYLVRMKGLDEKYYNRFMTNHELWDYESNIKI